MSSTTVQDRGDAALAHHLAAAIATWAAALLFLIALISFRPFGNVDVDPLSGARAGGDVMNQLGFGMMGALALLLMLCLAHPKRLTALISFWWLLMLVFLAVAAVNAADPIGASRTFVFTLMGILMIAAVVTLPRNAAALVTVLAFASIVVLAICYFGIVAMPVKAIHQAVPPEPEHVGLWRGSFTHKNTAGPVMACLGFVGLYLFRYGWRVIGAAVFVGAMIFVLKTGSKATAGLVPLAILIVALPSIMGLRRLTILLFFSVLIFMGLATLGIVFIEPLKQLAAEYMPGTTYTGRTMIWGYAGEKLLEKPWFGYGLNSFWKTPEALNNYQAFDEEWGFFGAGHAHNGYLDIAIYMGLPAMCAAIVTLVIAPARDYLRVPLLSENILFADLCLMIVLFVLLNAFP